MVEEGGVDETDEEDSEDLLMLTISGCLITLTGTLSDARLTQSDHILPHPVRSMHKFKKYTGSNLTSRA